MKLKGEEKQAFRSNKRQLTMCTFYLNFQNETFYIPRPYHFKPPGLNHFVTVIYPEGKPETQLGKNYMLSKNW